MEARFADAIGSRGQAPGRQRSAGDSPNPTFARVMFPSITPADEGLSISPIVRRDRMARLRLLPNRSEEHTSELPSIMRNSYAVSGLKKKQETIQRQRI